MVGVAALALILAPACADDDPPAQTPEPEPGTVVEVAVEAGQFTILAAALNEAGLVGALSGAGPFTVFAPTDEAFAAAGISAEDLAAIDNLDEILTYHVLAGRVPASAVAAGPRDTLAGLTAWLGTSGGVTINGAAVTSADVNASNGVIHVIDRVLMPPNIADFASYTGVHGTLLAALAAADLVGAVTDNDAPITVFAPTDAAIDATLAALGLTVGDLVADPITLTTLLTYHVLPSVALSADVVALDGESIAMLSGELAVVDATALTLGGAKLNAELLDIRTTNGVIHVLDQVMVPPSLGVVEPPPTTIIDVAEEAGTFSILLAALDAASLTEVLADADATFTVFAPTDAVFEAYLDANGLVASDLLALPNLAEILLYHVIAGAAVGSGDVATGPAVTAAELSVWLTAEEGDVRVNGATVVSADQMADNGVIHVIDGILFPANVAELAGFAGLDTLVAAVVAAGLVEAITDNDDPITVFAPTEQAFAALLADLGVTAADLLADDDLATTLTYHVVGAAIMSPDVPAGAPVTTVAELSVWARSGQDGVFVNEAEVVLADIVATNGVVHVIDAVLLPLDIAQFAGLTGVHGNLVAALGAAGLVGAVTENEAPITVFAPTDAAFEAAVAALGTTLGDLLADTATLTTILTHHVLGSVATSADVVALDGQTVTMLGTEGATIDAGALTIGGASLNPDLLDIMLTNGVLHVLDDVMVPPSLTSGD